MKTYSAKRRAGDDSDDIPQLKKRPKILKQKKDTVLQQKKLTQLHFCIDAPILRTCPLCQLSYTKGAPADEALHRAHCGRVMRGMEWGREEEREVTKAEVIEVVRSVKLKDGRTGRIISFPADVHGKIGAKLATLLETINITLSAPALPSEAIRASRVYLFLIPSKTNHREKIVGCVLAQRIHTAMAVADPPAFVDTTNISDTKARRDTTQDSKSKTNPDLIPVCTTNSLYCHPNPLPTPLGIPRLFVASSSRRQGIAAALLSAAARTAIHGCSLDPSKGEIAFSQPTAAGAAVMRSWGKGGVRVFEE